MKYVKRKEYLDFLNRHRDKKIIKIVSGVRRSGKSTLFELFKDELRAEGIQPDQLITMNFEDMDNEPYLQADKLYHHISKLLIPNKMNYVFLDEIQNVDHFEKAVNSLFLKDNVDLYLTGSNAYFLSSDIATVLSGRYVELKMLPLSFKEYVEWNRQNNVVKKNEELFNQYLESSFPYTLFVDSEKEKLEYLQGIYSTVVLKDIVARLSVRDVEVLERIIRTLFSDIGSLVNVNKIKNTLVSSGYKASNPSISNYLTGITDSLIMYPVSQYDIHGRRLLGTQKKYYAVDVGLRRLLLADHRQDFGHIIENIVFLELKRRGYEVYVGNTGKYEVDFVAVDAKQNVEYYQVSLTTLDEKTLQRELRSLQAINDQYPKYLITLDQINRTANYNGIQKMNLIDWLLASRN